MFFKSPSSSDTVNQAENDLLRRIKVVQEERFAAESLFANANDAYGVEQAIFAIASADRKYERLLLEAREKGVYQHLITQLTPWPIRWARQNAKAWSFNRTLDKDSF